MAGKFAVLRGKKRSEKKLKKSLARRKDGDKFCVPDKKAGK
jgi:hypothetical protein